MASGSTPATGRPEIPESYGVPKGKKGLLPWSHAEERLAAAQHYWVGTARRDGRPHAVPIWGLWHEGALYVGGDQAARWVRNLAANPAVVVHLESASDPVIVEGIAEVVAMPPRSLSVALAAASGAKYGFAPPPESYEGGGLIQIRPRRVIAWGQSLANTTRWTFAEE